MVSNSSDRDTTYRNKSYALSHCAIVGVRRGTVVSSILQLVTLGQVPEILVPVTQFCDIYIHIAIYYPIFTISSSIFSFQYRMEENTEEHDCAG